MNSLTITKTGKIELYKPIKIQNVSLKSITLFQTAYNLAATTEYKHPNKEKITIPPGYYTYEELRSKMGGGLKVDPNTLKVAYVGDLTGGLKDLIQDEYIYLTPLSLYLYIDGIDTSKNLLDGKRSSLLSIIPVGKTNVGKIIQYQPFNNRKCTYLDEMSQLNVEIKDEFGNDYKGKFNAELQLW